MQPNIIATPAGIACPVCQAATVIHDVLDFNKICLEDRQHSMPLCGWPVYYHRCTDCGFVLAPEFGRWSEQDFQQHVYNERYVEIDPDYVSARPLGNADFLQQLFGEQSAEIRHQDYGGGSGVLSDKLSERGWNSSSFDPFPRSERTVGDLGKFNLVTAFEVFEHVPDVNELMDNITALMEDECVVIFSTLLSDGNIEPNKRLTWWYAAPRNGHISLFSKQSLIKLAEQRGLQFGSFNGGLHCIFNRLPRWASKLTG
ncbi:class I SAM-dependent methyltransferase [Duganella sp. P38]|uniref:class I SAM-dependent methyltransferase n=1 Tax=Duganella sp. P38 TaxID=3423949 RepID=UPI003D78E986